MGARAWPHKMALSWVPLPLTPEESAFRAAELAFQDKRFAQTVLAPK